MANRQKTTLLKQKYIAQIIIYSACVIGVGLGIMWIWLGIMTLQRHTLWDQYYNPLLLVVGVIVLFGTYGIYIKSRAIAVLLTVYAVIEEILLQHYNYVNHHHFKFKPYFIYELAGLALMLTGVFWYNAVVEKLSKSSNTAKSSKE